MYVTSHKRSKSNAADTFNTPVKCCFGEHPTVLHLAVKLKGNQKAHVKDSLRKQQTQNLSDV